MLCVNVLALDIVILIKYCYTTRHSFADCLYIFFLIMATCAHNKLLYKIMRAPMSADINMMI